MELVKTEKELNAKQKKFCQEYLYGEHQGNGTKCYRKAYERCVGVVRRLY